MGLTTVSPLTAIGPLDGRYRAQLEGLDRYASEAALVRYRLRVEAAWMLHLAAEPAIAPSLRLPGEAKALLEAWAKDPDPAAPEAVKAIEARTNHDVKAVEYVLRDALERAGATKAHLAFAHFACTSEDINNLSYALMLKDLRRERLLPAMDRLLADLGQKAKAHAALPMLSRTHGQTASPTTLGKELAVFGHRLLKVRDAFEALPLEGKINGAVGNYNAHVAAYPEVDWPRLARRFVEDRLGLAFNELTTQIENHDSMVVYGRLLEHFNTILIGLARDVWGYVSLGYFRQKTVAGEVGSSTMPHKVNPIDFENAEGNLGLANALAVHFAQKLPISRWQRDLSDSTVQRALGTMVGHTELAWRSLLKGLGKLEVDAARIAADLDGAWEVLGEAVQTVMRRYGVEDAYERLKAATRGRPTVTRDDLLGLIDECRELPAEAKEGLRKLTPQTYTGVAKELAEAFAAKVKL